jgi:O-methyltransferase
MGSFFAHGLRHLIRRAGIDVVRYRSGQPLLPADLDPPVAATIRRVQAYTMTSPERLNSLIAAVQYISRAKLEGDIVECGVWRGGSMMASALTLMECGDLTRNLHLFDTFDGMAPPTDRDVAIDGSTASGLLKAHEKTESDSVWCYATLDQVRLAMNSTGYPEKNIHYVQGKVEDTIPQRAPLKIALLRLDTDWYESTRHELEHLFPRLVTGGVLIIDDYGHWKGAREAVDEYLAGHGMNVLLNRIDYTGRIAVKTW